MERTQLIRNLNERFSDASAQEIVNYFLQEYQGRIALSSSLSLIIRPATYPNEAEKIRADTMISPSLTFEFMLTSNQKIWLSVI